MQIKYIWLILVNDFTIVAYSQLYCDRQIERNMIQAALPIGSILGLLIMNVISDLKGRRFALIIALSVAIAGIICWINTIIVNIFGSYSNQLEIMIFAQVLSGFGGYSLVIISYIIPYDFC